MLGSSGSVVPIFRRQIAAGGPVTVTDPRMKRYFMTIPEAVQLIIRAGSLSERSGEVFVLEMGEPVGILDLAKTMIHLSGLEPERDIAIEIVGARPGEKLHEELFNPYERLQPTPAQKILRAAREPLEPQSVERIFGEINLLVLEGDAAGLAKHVAKLSDSRLSQGDSVRNGEAVRRGIHSDLPWPPDVDWRLRVMASLPFALSVHHFISSVGADAGFASLIGLALLILLYFAHARETATLRSRADEAGFRVQELETQLADLADQVAALPAEISVRATGPRVAAAQAGIAQRAVAGVGADRADGLSFPPAAPAGMAAPALAAATRLIPMPELPAEEPQPATMHGGAPNGTTPVPVAASGTMQRPVPVGAPVGPRPRQPAEPGRTAGGAGGYPNRPNGGQSRPTSGQRRVGGQPNSGGGQSNSGAGRPAMPVRPAPKRSRTGRTILAVLVALIGAAAVVVAVLVLSKGSGSHKPKSSLASTLTSHRTAPKGTVNVRPSDVTVSVLNGTDQQRLAMHRLEQAVCGRIPEGGRYQRHQPDRRRRASSPTQRRPTGRMPWPWPST